MKERRAEPRHPTRIEVDYGADGTFLFAYITDISSMGIFLQAQTVHPPGTKLDLRFSGQPPEGPLDHNDTLDLLTLRGTVVWTTEGDGGHERGMGIRFDDPSEDDRNRLQELVAAIAYFDE